MGDGFAEGLAVGQNNGNNAWGGEWIWVIVLFALFGWAETAMVIKVEAK